MYDDYVSIGFEILMEKFGAFFNVIATIIFYIFLWPLALLGWLVVLWYKRQNARQTPQDHSESTFGENR